MVGSLISVSSKYVAGRVDHADVGVEGPFKRAAGRIVPGKAGALRGNRRELVANEIEAVLEVRVNGLDFGVEHGAFLAGHAVGLRIDGRRVELIAFLKLLDLAVVEARVLHLNRVQVVGIKAENRNAGIGLQLAVGNLVLDFLAVELRNNADFDVLDLIAAVANHGRQRSNVVRVDDHFADVALNGKCDGGTGGTAAREGGAGNKGRRHHGSHGLELEFHLVSPKDALSKSKDNALIS